MDIRSIYGKERGGEGGVKAGANPLLPSLIHTSMDVID